MKIDTRIALTVLLSLLPPACTTPSGEINKVEFASPSSAYRPAPFWSWNDRLDDDELRWQVRQLKAVGYGGFFMHPRVGLETEYLADEWFDRIGACVDEARRQGLLAWLYDEDKWPSGFAGGWMTRKYPETRGVGLVGEDIKPEALKDVFADKDTVAVFAQQKDGKGAPALPRRLAAGDPLQPGETAVRFRTVLFEKNNWFNGEAYVDMLDPETVRKFLDLTMTGYLKRFRGDYGRTVPGVFMDEPNYHYFGRHPAMPWTARMPELFRQRWGYDLLERLPALTNRVPGFEQVRYHFWRLATELFADAFGRQYGEYCAKHGLKLTGHWLCEDNLRQQVEHIGAAMPHYEFEQVPGIDHLSRNIADPLTLKQVASAAHQFGRQQVLCEIFGVSGQDFRFEDAKWIGDFHIALGVNYFCPHLMLYSFTGDRKRDYPPTFSYHQPYWSKMGVVNDYFARAGYLTRLGEPHCRILLLHSIPSAWAYFSRAESCPEVDRFNNELVAAQNALLARHRDFDYGDEIILSRHGRVTGREVHVASHGRYDTVIVPPSFTWAESTVALLEAFGKAGGRIIVLGEPPRAIEGRPAPERWESLLKQPGITRCENQPAALAAALDAAPRDVRIVGDTGHEVESILYHHRTLGERHIFFFANTDRKAARDATITLCDVKGMPIEYDLGSGATRPIVRDLKPDVVFQHHFEPAGSLAVVVEPPAVASALHTVGAATRPADTPPDRQLLHGDWLFSRTHPNSLVLDVCNYSIGDAPMSPPTPVWKVRGAAREAAGLGQYSGIQPWVLTQRGIKPDKTARVQMRFEFESDVGRPTAWLVVEKTHLFAIRLNGQGIPTDTKEWHWDKQFTKMPVGALVRKGTNELLLTTDYKPGTEIEDVFLVGDFAVRKASDTRYVITTEPKTLATGDWVPQGYPFYAGNMVYRKRFEQATPPGPGQRVLVRLVNPRGTLFDILVNGRLAGTLAWQPWEADITGLVREGTNDLEIVVYGSLRNTFGPLHNTMYETAGPGWWWGPESFTDAAHWTDRYLLAPYGLIYGAELITVR